MRKTKKFMISGLSLLIILVLVIVWKMGSFLGDLPYDTHLTTPHLTSPVKVVWDRRAVPNIEADSPEDAYFVQGFITARDRFFQMDLTRRKMAGTLTELFGSKALSSDKKSRKWNFSGAAKKAFDLMSTSSKFRLNQYAAGVNAFLATESPSWEYFLLRKIPKQWQPEDSFLVVLSMYDSLNRHDSPSEQSQLTLKSTAPQNLYLFLKSESGFLDAPLIDDSSNPTGVQIPTEREFKVSQDFKFDASVELDPQKGRDLDKEPGSNAWVISGKLSPSGKPILASDPHLDLRIPNLWYRVQITTPQFNVRGVTIPGVPGLVIGRNQKIAWAFTNSSVDNSDHILIDASSETLIEREESFYLPDGRVEKEVFQDTRWGPVFSRADGSLSAIHWSALDPHNLKTLDLTEINSAQNKEEFLTAMRNWAGPVQNLIFGTLDGDIGWTLVGKIPNRKGSDGSLPLKASTNWVWHDYLDPSQVPIVLNPKTDYLVNANQRTIPLTERYKPFGHHWPNAARAKRITDRLKGSQKLSVRVMESIQNDNVSLTHLYYRDELNRCLSIVDKSSPQVLGFYQALDSWNGQTDIDSKVFSFLREFRFEAMNTLLIPIAWTLSPHKFRQLTKELIRDDLVKKIIDSKAKHLLAPQFKDHCEALHFAFKRTLKKFPAQKIEEVPAWGKINRSNIQHPFSKLLPDFLKPLLNFPQREMAGDYLVPRVMTPTNGASMRLVMDLGNPQASVFSQPGGQSSRPFSRYYQDLFSDWIAGKSIPFEAEGHSESEVFSPAP